MGNKAAVHRLDVGFKAPEQGDGRWNEARRLAPLAWWHHEPHKLNAVRAAIEREASRSRKGAHQNATAYETDAPKEKRKGNERKQAKGLLTRRLASEKQNGSNSSPSATSTPASYR
jgi:hypothetical protein